MKRVNLKSMVLAVLCFFFVVGLVTGCTSTKNFLGYFKFWGPKEESTAMKETKTEEMSAFMSQVRTARGNPDSHYLLATHYQQRGRHREAIEEFRKVVFIDPQHVKAYNGLGVSYDKLREFDKAQESYRMAMSLAPQQHYVYNNLGYSLLLKGNYEAAVEVLQKGIALDQGNEQMNNNLAMAYAALGKNDLALAALEQTKRPAEARFTLAQIHKQEGRLGDAETFFAAATSLDPSLERTMQETERFVTRVTRSIKETRQAKAGPVKERQTLSKTPNQPAKEAKKVILPARTAKTRTSKMTTLKMAKLEPDFLMNKTVAMVINKDIDEHLSENN